MTRKELDNHFRMVQRLHDAKELYQHMCTKSSGSGFLAAEIEDLAVRIDCLEKMVQKNASGIVSFMETIHNTRIRSIFRLRYINGLAWCEIPGYIGKGVSVASVKVACNRYLRERLAS